jgi:hypothetical protein
MTCTNPHALICMDNSVSASTSCNPFIARPRIPPLHARHTQPSKHRPSWTTQHMTTRVHDLAHMTLIDDPLRTTTRMHDPAPSTHDVPTWRVKGAQWGRCDSRCALRVRVRVGERGHGVRAARPLRLEPAVSGLVQTSRPLDLTYLIQTSLTYYLTHPSPRTPHVHFLFPPSSSRSFHLHSSSPQSLLFLLPLATIGQPSSRRVNTLTSQLANSDTNDFEHHT